MINMVRELREREGADLKYQRMSLMAETSSRTVYTHRNAITNATH